MTTDDYGSQLVKLHGELLELVGIDTAVIATGWRGVSRGNICMGHAGM